MKRMVKSSQDLGFDNSKYKKVSPSSLFKYVLDVVYPEVFEINGVKSYYLYPEATHSRVIAYVSDFTDEDHFIETKEKMEHAMNDHILRCSDVDIPYKVTQPKSESDSASIRINFPPTCKWLIVERQKELSSARIVGFIA